jgi:hypothetical protein
MPKTVAIGVGNGERLVANKGLFCLGTLQTELAQLR